MVNYNYICIQDYPTNSSPLRELIAHFQWKAEQQKAFEKLKDALTSVPVMSYFDTKKDTIIAWSQQRVGDAAVTLTMIWQRVL